MTRPERADVPRVLAINQFLREHFVHLISLLALLAFLTPGVSRVVREVQLLDGRVDASGVSLFLMMLSAAIQCSLGAFRRVVARPRPLVVCIALFFVVLPLSCWLLGHLCVPLLGRELGESIEIGLDLVILMPVAATATLWVRDARGDIELLVGLIIITMSLGTLAAPVYLHFLSGLAASSIVIPQAVMWRRLGGGVLAPLVLGMVLNRVLRRRLPRVQPYFSLAGNAGLFMAVYLNVGTAAPVMAKLPAQQIAVAVLLVLAVNLLNFAAGSLFGRFAGLGRDQQITCEFSSGMRSNGTALVVGLASFPNTPLVTVPAAIYIIGQHLIAGVVKSRLLSRFGDSARPVPSSAVPPGPPDLAGRPA
jgi:bile acid:Na+ symporter, BASS family